MAKIINRPVDRSPFEITKHRFNSLFTPIQKTRTKQSDFVLYITAPLMDRYIFVTYFALDLAINLINGIASLLKACYIWTLNQQQSGQLIDRGTWGELKNAYGYFKMAASDVFAPLLNIMLSVLSLATRLVASLVYAIFGDNSNPSASEYPQNPRGRGVTFWGPAQGPAQGMDGPVGGAQTGVPLHSAPHHVPPFVHSEPTAPLSHGWRL